MEIIRRKFLQEEFISRASDSTYGSVNKEFMYLNVFLTQDMNNMGIFTDQSFIESIVVDDDKQLIFNDLRPNLHKKKWFKVGSKITADTDSKLINLKGYKETNRYKKDFDSKKETYVNFQNFLVEGVSRITEKTNTGTTYVFDAPNDGFIGTPNQTEGLLYQDTLESGTTVTFQTQGINNTNSSLSALTKEGYLMGIISKPEIQNDVFINRAQVSPMEPHLRLSEIETLEHLMNYGNGYFNVVK